MAVAAARFPKKFFMPDPLRLLADDGADHDEPGGREGPTTKPRDQPPVSEILDGPEVRLAQVLPILHRAWLHWVRCTSHSGLYLPWEGFQRRTLSGLSPSRMAEFRPCRWGLFTPV